MKMFDWANKKLLHQPRSNNKVKKSLIHGRTLNQISNPLINELDEHNPQLNGVITNVKNKGASHNVEILTIGTLGVGDLLSVHYNSNGEKDYNSSDNEVEEDCDDYDEDKGLAQCNGSPCDSPLIARASISSVDIQKLQEELQRILYFKLGDTSKGIEGDTHGNNVIRKHNRKRKDHKKHNSSNLLIRDSSHGVLNGNNNRGVFPLHNFLEMPIENISSTSTSNNRSSPVFMKQWLLQSIRSKVLHCSMPTLTLGRVIPAFVLEKLIKSRAKEISPHITLPIQSQSKMGKNKMDKLFHTLKNSMARGGSRSFPKKPRHKKMNEMTKDNNRLMGKGLRNNANESDHGNVEGYYIDSDDDSGDGDGDGDGDDEYIRKRVRKMLASGVHHKSPRVYNSSALRISSSVSTTTTTTTRSSVSTNSVASSSSDSSNLSSLSLSSSSSSSSIANQHNVSPPLNECWINTDDEYLVLEL